MPSRRAAHTWFLIACVIPCVAVFVANAVFVWNHFVHGPYLHDSGWYAAIVWRSGLLPVNPPSVHFIREYYGIHFSPLVSVASLLSYLAPIGRVRWYAVFQGAIYLPLGAVVALLVGREGRRESVADALLVGVVALIFAFNGQVLACSSYPHYEIFVPSGLCLMLAGLATARPRLAWLGLAFAAMTREDGGFHVAFFAAAVVASDLLGRPFAIARRKVVWMGAIGLGVSLLSFAIQKKCFTTANLFRHEYLGEPAFRHLGGGVLRHRLEQFFSKAGLVSFPLVGTVILAIVRRDARYLLGWVAELPWLLLNLLAAQELKAEFSIYTGFPFVASIFWVAAYSRSQTADPAGRAWLGGLAAIALLSTLGLFRAFPGSVVAFAENAFVARPAPHALEALADALDREPEKLGGLYVDGGVTSWAPTRIDDRTRLFRPDTRDFSDRSGALFFADGLWREGLLDFLVASPFRECARAPGTTVFYCGRDERAFPNGFERSSPLLAMSSSRGGRPVANGAVQLERAPEMLFGPFSHLARGRYVASWKLRWSPCQDSTAVRATVDAFDAGHVLASSDVHQEERPELAFDLPQDAHAIELRVWAKDCGFAVEDLRLRQAE